MGRGDSDTPYGMLMFFLQNGKRASTKEKGEVVWHGGVGMLKKYYFLTFFGQSCGGYVYFMYICRKITAMVRVVLIVLTAWLGICGVSAIAAWVTFEAFWVQYESNHYQRLDILKERFENNFFNFINILTNKIDNTVMDNVGTGHQVFHYMFYEYKAMLYHVHSTNKYKDYPNRVVVEKIKTFDLFLNGVSASSTSRLEEKNKDEMIIIDLNNELVNLQESYLKNLDKPVYLKDYKGKEIKLFDGHRLRLIPFYRNFFIALQYIYKNLNGSEFVDEIDFYTKTMLSQMSEHELALIYLIFNYGMVEGSDFILQENKDYIMQFMKEVLPNYLKSMTMNCLKDGFIRF